MSIRKAPLLPVLLLAFTAMAVQAQSTARHPLTEVYQNSDFQLTGITVSKTGRFFVNFPRWSDRYQNAVVEVMPNGSTQPFPNADWNKWDMKPQTSGSHFVCVQSVVVDSNNALWAVDAAALLLTSPVPNGPKLVKIDLSTNQVSQVIPFGPDIALPDSYLNDVRIDNTRKVAYITDSGHGGIVIVDLTTGKARRVLDGDPSVLVESGVPVFVLRQPVIGPTGQPPMFNSDGIALSPDNQYLYHKAVTSVTLYRVPTSVLLDASASPATVSAAVQKVATIFPTDGLWMDQQGRLYLTDIDHAAVRRLLPNGTVEVVAQDPRLQWTDTFTEGPDGAIYISASHINQSPTYNNGYSKLTDAYQVFKINP